jgi:hypothetical protein
MAVQSTIGIFDAYVAFEQPTEFQRSAVDMPDARIDCLEADVFPGTGGGDVDPLMVPPDATVGADIAHLEAVGVLERWQFGGHCPRGGLVAGSGGAPVERLMRPCMVELVTAVVELPLLRAGAASPVWKWPVQAALHTSLGVPIWPMGLPGCRITRRLRFLGTTPWRLRMSQTVEWAGQGQRGWRVLRIATSFLAPQDGCRWRAARIAATTYSGVWRGDVRGRRARSSRPCGPRARERSIHVSPVLRLTP